MVSNFSHLRWFEDNIFCSPLQTCVDTRRNVTSTPLKDQVSSNHQNNLLSLNSKLNSLVLLKKYEEAEELFRRMRNHHQQEQTEQNTSEVHWKQTRNKFNPNSWRPKNTTQPVESPSLIIPPDTA